MTSVRLASQAVVKVSEFAKSLRRRRRCVCESRANCFFISAVTFRDRNCAHTAARIQNAGVEGSVLAENHSPDIADAAAKVLVSIESFALIRAAAVLGKRRRLHAFASSLYE